MTLKEKLEQNKIFIEINQFAISNNIPISENQKFIGFSKA